MFEEKSLYQAHLPVSVLVATIEDYPTHFHNDIEVIYLLRGKIELTRGGATELLKEGAIRVINRREIHSLSAVDSQNVVMCLKFDANYFLKYYPNIQGIYFSEAQPGDLMSVESAARIMGQIMEEFLLKGYGYEQKVIESMHNLIACLIAGFGGYEKTVATRLWRITNYMCDNHTRKLTLNEIAETEDLSIYYLSHLIKESTGFSFQDLLSFIRVVESENLLLNTDKKLGNIAGEMGFSALRYYVKHFETHYGMHPLDYRKKYANVDKSMRPVIGKAKYKRSSTAEIEEAFSNYLTATRGDTSLNQNAEIRIVDLDLAPGSAGNVAADLADAKGNRRIQTFLNANSITLITRPYQTFIGMGERLLYRSANCAISTDAGAGEVVDHLSILIYNFGDETVQQLNSTSIPDEKKKILAAYSHDLEMLVRCTGMAGDYKVSRYLISRENILGAYENARKRVINAQSRESALALWTTMPTVLFGELKVSDTISVRSTLKGISAELILIDRK